MKKSYSRIYKSLLITIASVVFMSTTCDEPTPTYDSGSVTLSNQSDEPIYWAGLDYSGKDNEDMTVFQALKKSSLGLLKLGVNEEILTHFAYDPMGYINFQLMVFKQSTLDKYSSDYLIEHNIYDKLYNLDSQVFYVDLKRKVVFE